MKRWGKCVHNNGYADDLTEGKMYELIEHEDQDWTYFIGDNGTMRSCYLHRFELVDTLLNVKEHLTSQEKSVLKELLDLKVCSLKGDIEDSLEANELQVVINVTNELKKYVDLQAKFS